MNCRLPLPLSFHSNFLEFLLEVVDDVISSFLYYIPKSLKLMTVYKEGRPQIPRLSAQPSSEIKEATLLLRLSFDIESKSTTDMLILEYGSGEI